MDTRGGKQTRSADNQQEAKNSNTITCFRCGTKGHPQKLCTRIPTHLVALYKKSKNANNQESHGTFLEHEECLEEYTQEEALPQTHMISHRPDSLSLDDVRTCIVDSGTSHTILKCKN